MAPTSRKGGRVRWVDGRPARHVDWGPGEPTSDGVYCNLFQAKGYAWNDEGLSTSQSYICEWPDE